MAGLKGTDLLAVYRATGDTFGNYSASVDDIIARVPSQGTPTLTAVLQENNTSQNYSIIIDNAQQDTVCTLSSTNGTDNVFALNSRFTLSAAVGDADQILLRPAGEVVAYDLNLFGNTTTANALRIFEAGATLQEIDDGDATATVTISNTGAATFAGALEALSINGGVYATE